jgi:anti-sigma B factor antagonist
MDFSTYVAHCDRYTLVMLHGEIDAYTGPRLEYELTALIDAAVAPLIVDMCAVDFCDSWGLNVVVTAKRHAAERGVRMGLVGLTPQVRMVFHVTGVDHFIPVFNDLRNAVHELTGS